MNTTFPQLSFFTALAVPAPVFWLLTGICVLLAILLVIVIFSVAISLVVVSGVHIICRVLHQEDVEASPNRRLLEILDQIGRRQWRTPEIVEVHSLEKEKTCPICLEDYVAGDVCRIFPVCNHVFHSDCIGNWLKKNPTCPLCRSCLFEV